MRPTLFLSLALLAAMTLPVEAAITLRSSVCGSAGGIITSPDARLGLGFTAGQPAIGLVGAPGPWTEAVGFWHESLPILVAVEFPAEPLPETFTFTLLPSIPNPFDRQTLTRFTLPTAAGEVAVRIELYDVSGRFVRLLDHSRQGPGAHAFVWDGTDRSGAPAGDGIYFCRIQAGPFRAIRRLVLMR